jgi:hypothetical protein
MVPAQEVDLPREVELQTHEIEERVQRVESAVDIVTHEQERLPRREIRIAIRTIGYHIRFRKQPFKIVELVVGIAADVGRRGEAKNIVLPRKSAH